jgi:hypothetical protein
LTVFTQIEDGDLSLKFGAYICDVLNLHMKKLGCFLPDHAKPDRSEPDRAEPNQGLHRKIIVCRQNRA